MCVTSKSEVVCKDPSRKHFKEKPQPGSGLKMAELTEDDRDTTLRFKFPVGRQYSLR